MIADCASRATTLRYWTTLFEVLLEIVTAPPAPPEPPAPPIVTPSEIDPPLASVCAPPPPPPPPPTLWPTIP